MCRFKCGFKCFEDEDEDDGKTEVIGKPAARETAKKRDGNFSASFIVGSTWVGFSRAEAQRRRAWVGLGCRLAAGMSHAKLAKGAKAGRPGI